MHVPIVRTKIKEQKSICNENDTRQTESRPPVSNMSIVG